MTELQINVLVLVGNTLLFLLWTHAWTRKITDRCPRCGQKEGKG